MKVAAQTSPTALEGLADSLGAAHNLRVLVIWENVPGFLCQGPADAAAALANDPRVEIVEEDHVIIGATSVGTSVDVTYDGVAEDLWYLDRLDQAMASPRDDTYNMSPDAANLTAYVLDSAVWKDHAAFAERTSTIRTINCAKQDPVTMQLLPCVEEDAALACKDNQQATGVFVEQSHGTAVASLLSGNLTGAARPQIASVNIYPCITDHAMFPPPNEPLTGTSYTLASVVTNGLNWIKSDVSARNNGGRAIVNHSGFLYPWDDQTHIVMEAVRSVVYANIPYFTSADNFSGDSCAFTPNNYAYTRKNKHWTRLVFSVAGTTLNEGVVTLPDGRKRMTGTLDVPWLVPPTTWDVGVAPRRVRDTGTNLGACVSAFAPATHIYAAAHGPSGGTTTNPNYYRLWANGTSWSSPLAAALALRWMATQSTAPSYSQVYDQLLNKTTTVGAAANAAYTICYSSTDPTQWEYHTDPNHPCPTAYGTYRMPAATNNPADPSRPESADARMLYW